MSFEASLARIDALLHECSQFMAPGIDVDGDVSEDHDVPATMFINTWGLVCMYTDTESGIHYTRVFYPNSLPPAFLRGLLMDGVDAL